MEKLSLSELSIHFNTCWPGIWVAQYGIENFGRYNTVIDGKEHHWSSDREHITISSVKPRNPEKIQKVVVYRGEYPNFAADYLTVDIHTHYGHVQVGEKSLAMVSEYINTRLNDIGKYLDKWDEQYPVKWESMIVINNGRDINYTITGKAKIPLAAIGEYQDIQDFDDLCKLLLEAFYLAEHPNDIDAYLYLNENGLIDDSWTWKTPRPD